MPEPKWMVYITLQNFNSIYVIGHIHNGNKVSSESEWYGGLLFCYPKICVLSFSFFLLWE